jgi:hypothetical protein
MKQHKHDLSKYSYSTTAYWVNGLGLAGSSPKGILGITSTGRVEFTIDNGKLLFSAPVRLATCQARPGRIIDFYIGPRKYRIRLYRTSMDDSGAAFQTGIHPGPKVRDDTNRLLDRLKAMTGLPDDHRPVIAAVPTESTRVASRTGFLVTIYSTLILIGPIILAGVFFEKQLDAIGGFWQAVLVLVYFVVTLLPLAALDERRDNADQRLLHEADGKTQEADILPAGTLAARQHVTSLRVQYFWSIVIGVLTLPVLFVLVLTISALIRK